MEKQRAAGGGGEGDSRRPVRRSIPSERRVDRLAVARQLQEARGRIRYTNTGT